MLWYQQVTPHDLRDYDFQISPILTNESVGGVQTEVVIGAGKAGKVIAFRADNGMHAERDPVSFKTNFPDRPAWRRVWARPV